ncbi:MAG: two-component regulator propeller domain-containing protein [Bacteroidota bacterium]
MRLVLLLATLALLAPRSHAQPVWDVLTRAGGMPSDYVLAIHQDRWGFVWFGTDAGAVRWDGTRAQTFSVDDGLPHAYVQGFAETPDGTLWAATNAGLARRTEAGWEAVDSPLGREPVSRITTDDQGRLVASGTATIGRLEGDTWRTLRLSGGLGYGEAPILDVGDGRLLLSGFRDPAALLLTPEAGGFRAERVPIAGLSSSPSGAYVSIYATADGLLGLVVPQDAQLVRLRLEDGQLVSEAIVPLSNGARALARHDGDLYTIGSAGLRRLDASTGEAGPLQIEADVRAVTTDREGGMWVGTFGEGAARRVGTHLATLSDVPARRVALVGDEAWALGGRGATFVDLGAPTPEPWSLRQTGPRSIVATPDGRFRISGQASLFAAMTAETIRRMSVRRRLRMVAQDGDWVSGSAETADSLWMGSYGSGLRRFRKTPGGLVEIDTLGTDDGLPTEAVEDVIRTRAGTWAVTRRGLAFVHGGRAYAMGVADGLPSSAVYAIYEADDGTHWAGTDRGIARVDPTRWRAEAVGEREMAGRAVVAFVERRGALYAVTTQALWRVERGPEAPRSEAVRVRLVDAFPLVADPRHTVEHAVYHAASDRLVLATSGGLVLADLAALPASEAPPPPVAFVGATVDDEAVALAGTPRAARLAGLGPGRHRVEIQAAALQFGGDAGVEWRGADGVWHPADQGRIVLSDVGAGDHVVDVRAVAPSGAASGKPGRLAFRVAPRWWERRAVQALLAVLAFGALVGGVRYASQRRLRARVRELELAERVRAERERISRDLHDHVGAEVAAILTRAEVARLRAAAEGRDADAFRSVEQRARRTMGSLREAVWALGHDALTPDALADRLGAFARDQAAPLGLAVEAAAHGEVDRALSPTHALALYRIGQEAVRNAVRHSGGTRLRVTVEATGDRVAVVVRDDGAFGGPAGDGGGYGLGNIQARAEALGGTLALSNGDGTTVRAEIPVAG